MIEDTLPEHDTGEWRKTKFDPEAAKTLHEYVQENGAVYRLAAYAHDRMPLDLAFYAEPRPIIIINFAGPGQETSDLEIVANGALATAEALKQYSTQGIGGQPEFGTYAELLSPGEMQERIQRAAAMQTEATGETAALPKTISYVILTPGSPDVTVGSLNPGTREQKELSIHAYRHP